MSQKTKAQLTTDIAAIITGQTAPDAITPAILGGLLQDIADSFWNQTDDPTPIGGNTDDLETFLDSLNAQVQAIAMPPLTDPSLFRATKTVVQVPQPSAAAGNYIIYFEDDTTDPNFDNSNLFYTNTFKAKFTGTKVFATEAIKIKVPSFTSSTFRVRILKNNSEIATTPTISSGATDVYGFEAEDPEGYTFPPLITPPVTLAVNDELTAEVVKTGNSDPWTIEIGGVFSNS